MDHTNCDSRVEIKGRVEPRDRNISEVRRDHLTQSNNTRIILRGCEFGFYFPFSLKYDEVEKHLKERFRAQQLIGKKTEEGGLLKRRQPTL